MMAASIARTSGSTEKMLGSDQGRRFQAGVPGKINQGTAHRLMAHSGPFAISKSFEKVSAASPRSTESLLDFLPDMVCNYAGRSLSYLTSCDPA
jgi:hypothetical protein